MLDFSGWPRTGWVPDSTQRVRFFNIRSGIGTNKHQAVGRVGVLKYTIGYFRVFFYTWVFPGIPEYFRVFLGIYDIISFLGGMSEPNTKFFFLKLREFFKVADYHNPRLSLCYTRNTR